VPRGGSYENVPASFEVASNCAALNGVPKVMGAGVAQVIWSGAFPPQLVSARQINASPAILGAWVQRAGKGQFNMVFALTIQSHWEAPNIMTDLAYF